MGVPFGVELSYQAVGIFVCTTLMRAARISDIHFNTGISLESTAITELCAVIECHTAAVANVEFRQAFPDSLVYVISVLEFDSDDQRVAGFTVDQCHQTSAVRRSKLGVAFAPQS